MWVRYIALSCAFFAVSCGSGGGGEGPTTELAAFRFVDATVAAGFVHTAGFQPPTNPYLFQPFAGGVAAGDFDNDGNVDLYVIGGELGTNLLYRNEGDGTFVDVAAAAGVDLAGTRRSGPSFADYDGDGDLDLFVGGMDGTAAVLFRNNGNGTFTDVAASAGLVFTRRNTIGVAWADIDGDRDLDLFVAHYGIRGVNAEQPIELLWRNEAGVFTDVSVSSGLSGFFPTPDDEWSFTPNFADIDDDGDADLLLAGDFGASRVFRNNGAGVFTDATSAAIDDENGMGAAVGDFDNDGDLDWFVSSIFDADGVAEGNWGVTGNRLYKNDGDGNFTDTSEFAGVRDGSWGWGSCFADFDNDGWLDLFHVNGNVVDLEADFVDDASRLFLSAGDGTFVERSSALGIEDRDRGLGVVCLDFDDDGDLDLFIWNWHAPPRLLENIGGNGAEAGGDHLRVSLAGRKPNTQGIGARIIVTHDGLTQMREVRAGNNYVSQNAADAWFGLGPSSSPCGVRVIWPDKTETVLADVAPNQHLVISRDP
ncbi:MAG: CRTAC1 family protein [Planctomycetota bacterium]